jgi:hypothetical protein
MNTPPSLTPVQDRTPPSQAPTPSPGAISPAARRSRRRFLVTSGAACLASLAGGRPADAASAPAPAPVPGPDGAGTPPLRRQFSTARSDGRFVSTTGMLHAHFKHLRPRLAFDPRMKPEDFPAWRESVRRKAWELLRFPEGFAPQPPPKRLASEPRAGYRIEKWEAYPEPFSVVPFLILTPDGISARAPGAAVMCFAGSTSSKEMLAGELELNGQPSRHPNAAKNHMAREYARAGLVAVAMENPGTCELSDPVRPGRAELSLNGLWVDRPYEGLSVFQKFTVLQWLKTQPTIDAGRIALSGHSLGAKPALFVGLIDPSVKAVIWNDCLGSWRDRAVATNLELIGEWHYLPGMLTWFDYPDLQAALAPRPFLATEGASTAMLQNIQRAYALSGAANQVTIVPFEKFATPEQRPLDGQPVPEGLSVKEYNDYRNCDGAMHYFKGHLAVPWLRQVFALR